MERGFLDLVCLTHVHIEADFYLFQPTKGCILKGRLLLHQLLLIVNYMCYVINF